MKNVFGLIGFPLHHSWSPRYFQQKFLELGLEDYSYQLFPLESLDSFLPLLTTTPNLQGLNVTIPFKESILSYIDILDSTAKEIGAINTIVIQESENQRKLTGYNTDAEGFALSSDFSGHQKALVLGTGGASKAVSYALKNMGISVTNVTRSGVSKHAINYQDLTREIIENHTLIINTTPLGMYPKTEGCPDLPYQWVSARHFLYDLVYNPEETLFLRRGKGQGAKVQSGLKMLHCQAELALKLFLET